MSLAAADRRDVAPRAAAAAGPGSAAPPPAPAPQPLALGAPGTPPSPSTSTSTSAAAATAATTTTTTAARTRARPQRSDDSGEGRSPGGPRKRPRAEAAGGARQQLLDFVRRNPRGPRGQLPQLPFCRPACSYELEEVLGQGAFAQVIAARDKLSGELSALKRLSVNNVHSEAGLPLAVRRELEVLLQCADHPGIVRFDGVAVESWGEEPAHEVGECPGETCGNDAPLVAYLVLEHVETDLRELSRAEEDGLDRDQTVDAIFQTASALAYLHEREFMHRDVKPSNILYDCTASRAVLCDFGWARTMGRLPHRAYTSDCTTLQYRAPELLFGSEHDYGPAIDLWSLGCVFAELLLGEMLMPGERWPDQVRRYAKIFGRPDAAVGTLQGEVLRLCEDVKFISDAALPQALGATLDERARNLGKPALRLSSEEMWLLSGLLEPAASKRLTAAQVSARYQGTNKDRSVK